MERMTLVALVEAVASGECPPEVFVDEVVDAGVEHQARAALDVSQEEASLKSQHLCSHAGYLEGWIEDTLWLGDEHLLELRERLRLAKGEERWWDARWRRLEEAKWRVECLLPVGA